MIAGNGHAFALQDLQVTYWNCGASTVPAISLIYRYPLASGPGVSLSSGGHYSAHADFFNAWRQPTFRALVDTCLNALRHCARGS
jgi:hypothetical protein